MKLWLTRMHGNASDGRRTRWHITAAIDPLHAAQMYVAYAKAISAQAQFSRGVDVVPQREFTAGHLDIAIDKGAKLSENELRDRYLHTGDGDVVASEFSKLWDWTKRQHVRL
jgi:hypothetical protein